MMERAVLPAPEEKPSSANERFKTAWSRMVALAVIVSVTLHFAAFELIPRFRVADLDFVPDELAAVELPPEVRIPPPPEAILRPARPRVAEAVMDEDITISATTFEANPASELAPPPPGVEVDPSQQPVYVNRDIEPRLLNGPELISLMRELYPRGLKEAGVGGEVNMWVFVDEEGNPANAQIRSSSGYERLDETALTIAARMRFSPAMLRDQPIGVWIAQPISFSVGN
jgi:protein TonB